MKGALEIPVQTMSPTDLEACRGTFKKGHTSEDVDHVLDIVKKTTGLHAVVLWDFQDMWGCGGNSCIYLLVDGKLYDCPEELSAFLYDPDNEVKLEEVKEAKRGSYFGKAETVRGRQAITAYNYAEVSRPGKEMD